MPQDPNKKRKIALDAAAAPEGGQGRSWFFGIGINQYAHFPDLQNAVRDVQQLAELLQEHYDLHPDHTLTLYDEAATREHIIAQLDRLQREVGPADKLLIYYSGHGHLNPISRKGYWVPTDAEKDNTAHYIRNSTIRDYIEDLHTLHTLLISDSCFSGTLLVRGTTRATASVRELEQLPSRWVICSGRHDEEVYDGAPGSNSPFAESILDTLRRNQSQALHVAKLIDRVIEQTRSNYEQLPEGCPLYGVGHKGGQYIFHRRTVEATDWATAVASGKLADIRRYIKLHPDGQHREEAKALLAQKEEDVAWEKAQQTHSIVAYYHFDRAYPNGRYNQLALKAIEALEEEEAWRQAIQLDRLSAYRKYTLDYPQGKYRAEAGARMEAILSRLTDRKQTTESAPPTSAEAPARSKPQTGHSSTTSPAEQKDSEQEARARGNAWRKALQTNTEAAIQTFLDQYPRGQYTRTAKQKLKELQQKGSTSKRPITEQHSKVHEFPAVRSFAFTAHLECILRISDSYIEFIDKEDDKYSFRLEKQQLQQARIKKTWLDNIQIRLPDGSQYEFTFAVGDEKSYPAFAKLIDQFFGLKLK